MATFTRITKTFMTGLKAQMNWGRAMGSMFAVLCFATLLSCAALLQRPRVTKNPEETKLITTDIDNFYRAFDMAVQDTLNATDIFDEHYFQIGSKGLGDFRKSKIQSKSGFADFVIRHRQFYSSIQKNISDMVDLERQIKVNFQKFKDLYPEAVFPDVYFVMGRFSSNGTISKYGLLIGTELLSRTPDTDTRGWNRDILRISMERAHIPITVAHELVHFNQNGMKGGNTLLWKSIREGSAEFIAEIISGQTDGDYSEFKGREKEIWKDFKKDMDKSIWRSWQQPSEGRPRNAGYWAGYMICKSYYHQVGDKKKAIHDILNIKDHYHFYAKSKVEKYIEENH